jgi:hypothetical protein
MPPVHLTLLKGDMALFKKFLKCCRAHTADPSDPCVALCWLLSLHPKSMLKDSSSPLVPCRPCIDSPSIYCTAKHPHSNAATRNVPYQLSVLLIASSMLQGTPHQWILTLCFHFQMFCSQAFASLHNI